MSLRKPERFQEFVIASSNDVENGVADGEYILMA
jgi:hypothetical protein